MCLNASSSNIHYSSLAFPTPGIIPSSLIVTHLLDLTNLVPRVVKVKLIFGNFFVSFLSFLFVVCFLQLFLLRKQHHPFPKSCRPFRSDRKRPKRSHLFSCTDKLDCIQTNWTGLIKQLHLLVSPSNLSALPVKISKRSLNDLAVFTASCPVIGIHNKQNLWWLYKLVLQQQSHSYHMLIHANRPGQYR